MPENPVNLFFDKLIFSLEHKEFAKLVISKKRDKNSDLNKITVSPVQLKEGFRLSFVYNYQNRDITKNYTESEAIELLKKEFETHFLNADLFAVSENVQLFGNPKGNFGIKISEPVFKPIKPLSHDKLKKQLISTENNLYLHELGITNAAGEIRPGMHDKFRQINKYIEVVSGLIHENRFPQNLKIADMGSGKGYLTFALYDYLNKNTDLKPIISGVEFRPELVELCNTTARKANFDKLSFIQGTIENSVFDDINILIALHACDTATDDAIAKGIKSDAQLIIVAPCCHKQIRKQFNVTNELTAILKHGILKERQAELITDGIRALILEAYGYKTKVFEFISTEHTPKNVMIVAEKSAGKINKEEILSKIKSIKDFFGIRFHHLDILLGQ
jgi:hypothetical protein